MDLLVRFSNDPFHCILLLEFVLIQYSNNIILANHIITSVNRGFESIYLDIHEYVESKNHFGISWIKNHLGISWMLV